MKIIIATEDYSEILQQLMIKTWKETYPKYIAARGETFIAEEIKILFSLQKIKSNCNDENHKIWLIINEDDCAIGYAHLILGKKQNPFLEQIYIVKEEQGKGLGKLLLAKCYQTLIKKNYHVLELEVDIENENAIHFYQKQGFRILKKVPYIHDNSYANYIMKKDLKNPLSLSMWKSKDEMKLPPAKEIRQCIIL